MWVQADFPPDTFYDQTPRHFQLAMKGVRKRIEFESEMNLSLAWHTAGFNAATKSRQGLKPLKHYTRKQSAQSPREMVSLIKAMGARSNMKIRRIEREA